MRIAFDSNVLIYSAGGERIAADLPKIAQSQALLVELAVRAELVAPVQAIGEAIRILSRVMGKPDDVVALTLTKWETLFEPSATTVATLQEALLFGRSHRFQHWDSVIVCAAVAADCRLLLSEDMQHGFAWRGLTIVNPFADPMHPLLASLLDT